MLHVYPHPPFWILRIDGTARPNPGRMAVGVVLSAPDGACICTGQGLGLYGCNNEAELRALQLGLHMAHTQAAPALRIYTDSQWLVQQLQPPQPSVRPTARLQPLLDLVRAQLQAVPVVQWRWVPRRCNTQADALARQAAGIDIAIDSCMP